MNIRSRRKFGPFEPAIAVRAIKLLRRNGCARVYPAPGGYVEASVPMNKIQAVLGKMKSLPTKNGPT